MNTKYYFKLMMTGAKLFSINDKEATMYQTVAASGKKKSKSKVKTLGYKLLRKQAEIDGIEITQEIFKKMKRKYL